MDRQVEDETYDALGQVLKGKYLVGMKPRRFLDEFVYWNVETPLHYKEQKPSSNRVQSIISEPPTHQQNKEGDVSSKNFVSALDGWVIGTDTKQQLRFGHFTRPDHTCGSMNVEISTYWEDDFPNFASGSCTFGLHQTHEVLKSDIAHDAFAHPFDEGTIVEEREYCEVSEFVADDIEIFSSDESHETSNADIYVNMASSKAKKDNQVSQEDAALDGPQVFERKDDLSNSISDHVETDTAPGIRTRGQISAYAGAAMSMAFRTHLFSMLILGQYARFIRWDRRGAIVTNRFDYTQNPDIIFEFYLRYGQLTPRQRGFDTNVHPIKDGVPPRVVDAFNGYFPRSWYEGAKFGHKSDPSKHIPTSETRFFRIKIEDRTQGRIETFIIPPPVYKDSSLMPFGRASRRSLAYFDDAVVPKMCFFKDSWHDISERSAPEADVYRLLHSKNVPNLASMRLGDDVEGTETETQRWVSALAHSGRHKRIGTMVCHRLIMDTIARDLSTFTWCKVLLKCLADAVDAAQEAFKVGVLHRDISAGNIMIIMDDKTHELRGILIDWDLCLLLNQKNSSVDRTAMTGTWAFMSSRLLASAKSPAPVIHSLSDDMESVFWVLIYQLLRYTHHNTQDGPLYLLMKNLFDDAAQIYNGSVIGGQWKSFALLICNSNEISRLTTFTKPGLDGVLHQLGVLFNGPYKKIAQQQKNLNAKVKVLDGHLKGYDDDADSEEEPDYSDVEDISQTGRVEKPSPVQKDLNDPNENWLSKYLRKSARKMEPLGVTPTGLLSPKQNSRPPKDPARWTPALPSHYKVDFYHMWFVKDPNDTKLAQARRVATVTSSMINGMNGQSLSFGNAKSRLEDEEQEQNNIIEASSKRPRECDEEEDNVLCKKRCSDS